LRYGIRVRVGTPSAPAICALPFPRGSGRALGHESGSGGRFCGSGARAWCCRRCPGARACPGRPPSAHQTRCWMSGQAAGSCSIRSGGPVARWCMVVCPRWARKRAISPRSSSTASAFMVPPQRAQARASKPHTRFSRSAHFTGLCTGGLVTSGSAQCWFFRCVGLGSKCWSLSRRERPGGGPERTLPRPAAQCWGLAA